jgi:hypothetical protein
MRELVKKIRTYLLGKFRNSKYFYDNKMSSFSFGWLLYANLLKPSRSYRRWKNDNSGRFRLFHIASKSSPPKIGTNVVFDHSQPDLSFRQADLALRTHGAVVMENYFQLDAIARFTDAYARDIEKMIQEESRFGDPLVLGDELLNLWLNPALQGFMQKYLGTKPYCRSYPLLQYVDKNSTISNRATKKGIAYPWHIDHCPIFAQMVYLSDIHPNGTCMEIASGSHYYPNVGISLYSDEYIDYCGLPLMKLAGPKGSVQMHDPNVVHRARPAEGSDRLWLFSDFSWGENILLDLPTVVGMLANSDKSLADLNPIQREAMSGLFPQTPFKGYRMVDGFLAPQLAQEI